MDDDNDALVNGFDLSRRDTLWPQSPRKRYIHPLQRKIRRIIDDFQQMTFDAYNLDIRIVSLCATEYNIFMPGHENARAYQLNVDKKINRHLLVDEIQGHLLVIRNGTWMPLIDYLALLYPRRRVTRQSLGMKHIVEAKAHSWLHNGKHFALLALPRELREQVYLMALGPAVWWDSSSYDFNGALMATCRQVYQECNRIIKEDLTANVLYSDFTGARWNLFPSPRATLSYHAIQHVRVFVDELSISQVYDSVTAPGPSIGPTWRVSCGGGLSHKLNVVLSIPEPNQEGLARGACHETLVSTFLDVARRGLAGRNIRVQGYVTIQQKAIFDQQMQAAIARGDFAWAFRGRAPRMTVHLTRGVQMHRADVYGNEEGIRSPDGSENAPRSLPCTCSRPCTDGSKWRYLT